MVADASAYYLLTYRSARNTDGMFHAVDVSVKTKGVHLRARKGFWAPTPDEIQRASLLARANEPRPPIVLAPARRTSPMIRPWFGMAKGANGNTRVTFVWEPAGAVPGDRRVRTPVARRAQGHGRQWHDVVRRAGAAHGRRRLRRAGCCSSPVPSSRSRQGGSVWRCRSRMRRRWRSTPMCAISSSAICGRRWRSGRRRCCAQGPPRICARSRPIPMQCRSRRASSAGASSSSFACPYTSPTARRT